MAPNEIIEKLVNLVEHIEDLLRSRTPIGMTACESLRMRLIQLPQIAVDGKPLSHAASVREQLASFLQGSATETLRSEFPAWLTPGMAARIVDHFNGDLTLAQRHVKEYGVNAVAGLDVCSLPDLPKRSDEPPNELGTPPAAPAKHVHPYDEVCDGWTKVKEEFGVPAVKGLMFRLLHVTRLCDIVTSQFDISIELTHTIMQMKHDYVCHTAAGPGMLHPRTWLAYVKQPTEWAMATHQVPTQPATAPAAAPLVSPLEVKLARQVEGNYRTGLSGRDQCWFCSTTLPLDATDTLSEQHNEGCAVPLARQIIENYTADKEQL